MTLLFLLGTFLLLESGAPCAELQDDLRLVKLPPGCTGGAVYTSPSGEFQLLVRCLTPENGHGPAEYRLRRGGETLWKKTHPYTLCPAVVLCDGAAVGVATTNRRQNDPEFYMRVKRDFRVVMLDRNGNEAMDDKTVVLPAQALHVRRRPFARSILVDARRSMMILMALPGSNDGYAASERFWVYDIQKRSRVGEVDLRILGSRFRDANICGLKPIPGTNLALIHAIDNSKEPHSAVFVILNAYGELIWWHELTDDYRNVPVEFLGRNPAAGGARVYCKDLAKNPTFGVGDEPGSFWVRRIRESKPVHFVASKDASGDWEIVEKE